MRIIYNNEEFDMPSNFKTSVDLSSPLLTDRGEMTAPFTLPPSPKNLALIGHANRLDIYYKPITELEVIVQDGIFIRPCKMSILSASKTNGIGVRVYLDTSYFYSSIDGVMLSALPWPVVQMNEPDSLEAAVEYLVDYLKQQYDNPTYESIFCIAPVATTQKYTYQYTKLLPAGTIVENTEEQFVLNGFEKWKHGLDFEGTGSDELRTFQGEYTQKMIVSNAIVDIGIGYGMTPFVKLRALLETIFSTYGYTFEHRSIEDAINEYGDNICLYNNVADAIYNGTLRFSRLMPEVDIKTMLAKIEGLLCGRFMVNEIYKLVWFNFSSYSTNPNAVSSMDLTQYLADEPEMSPPEFKNILLADAEDEQTPDIDEKNTEIIKFNLLKIRKQEPDTYLAYGPAGRVVSVALDCVQGSGIVHKNSAVIIDGEKKDEDEKFSDILFLSIKNNQWYSADVNPPVNLQYKTTYNAFHSADDMILLNSLWNNYISFRRNSNVLITAPFKMPAHVLHKLVFDFPYNLAGTKVLIENISTAFGLPDSEREDIITFRTTRPFADRVD